MILAYNLPDGTEKKVRLKTIAMAKPITIGRGENADITIDDAKASRVHSAIRYWDDIFVVRDMSSKNGTRLNGELIEVAKLNAGDILIVGDTEFYVAAEEGSSSDITVVERMPPA